MTEIVLPDGQPRSFDGAVTGAELAASIGAGLARAALAVRVDGELRDLSRELPDGARVEIVTRDSVHEVRCTRLHPLPPFGRPLPERRRVRRDPVRERLTEVVIADRLA